MLKSHRLLETRVHKFTVASLNALVANAIESKTQCCIVSQNLHSLYLASAGNRWVCEAQASALVRIDGMPIVWLLKLFGAQFTRENRITWLDWYPSIFAMAEQNGWKIAWLGSSTQQHQAASIRLREMFPKLEIDFIDGFMESVDPENRGAAQLSKINAAESEILLLGLGMPLQEQWMVRHRSKVSNLAILSCGGLIDYLATGGKPPPRWMGRIGLEWVYRLLGNPARFWRRYLIEPFYLLPTIVRHLLRHYAKKR